MEQSACERKKFLYAENVELKQKIIHLRSTVQRLTAMLLNDAQLLMYTYAEVTRKVFESSLTWLQPRG